MRALCVLLIPQLSFNSYIAILAAPPGHTCQSGQICTSGASMLQTTQIVERKIHQIALDGIRSRDSRDEVPNQGTNAPANTSQNLNATGSPTQRTIEEMADLAYEAYPKDMAQGRKDVNDWKLQDQGDQYAIFINKDEKKVVLALRGIKPEEAFTVGLLLKAGRLTADEPVTRKWTIMAEETLSKARAYNWPITVVGHSLGGALTMLLASKNKDVEFYAFNPCGNVEEEFFKTAVDSKKAHVYFTKTDSPLFSGDLREHLKNQPSVSLVDATVNDPHTVLNFVSEGTREAQAQDSMPFLISRSGHRRDDVTLNYGADTKRNALGNDVAELLSLLGGALIAIDDK